MNRVTLVGAGILIASISLAGVLKTSRPGRFELIDPSGKLVGQYDTLELCSAGIPAPTAAGKATWRCKFPTYFDVEGTCEDVPAPIPETDVVFDPAAVKYAGPYCAEDETCLYVEPEEPGVKVTAEGTYYTFTYVGNLYPELCPGSDVEFCSVQKKYVRDNKLFPSCWIEVDVAKIN